MVAISSGQSHAPDGQLSASIIHAKLMTVKILFSPLILYVFLKVYADINISDDISESH
jgi:hypothetical protein